MDYIRVYSGNNLIQRVELTSTRVTIGRGEENTVNLSDVGVSKQHAAIEPRDGEYFIVDLGSRNGVFLNKKRVDTAKLKYWDEIQIHNFVIKFMSKAGIGVASDEDNQAVRDLEGDKTEFFEITDEEQLEQLRQKSKQAYLIYQDKSGTECKFAINKPRVIIGNSKAADIKIGGWFAPGIAASIERHGSGYELVPSKRGKVVYQSKYITTPTRLIDGSGFIVREFEFEYFNRLTDRD